MNGLRGIASWTMQPLRYYQRTNFRILGAARSPSSFNSSVEYDRGGCNLSLVNIYPSKIDVEGIGIPKCCTYSNLIGTQAPRKPRKFWSALAAGLLGIGGAIFLSKNQNENIFTKFIFPRVHCACADECVERKCESSDCLRKSDREEEMIQKANAELERALKDTKRKSVEHTEAALKAYCDAIEAIKVFMNKVYCAVEEQSLDSPRFEEVWCDVHDALVKRCDLTKKAMEKGQCAWELLRRLREIIENGRACKYTSCNPLLVTAEETLICAEKELCAKKAAMDAILKESRVAEQYRNIIEDFRRDFKAEADSLVPSEDCRVTLNENEANMVLTHAYKKILRIQKELTKSTKSKSKC